MIVVDVETTGINPERHSIVSIGALDFKNPSNQFYGKCKVWLGAEITDEALEINGFTREEITGYTGHNKVSLEQLIRGFISWKDNITDRTLAGENPSFDRDFLTASAIKSGLGALHFGYRVVDLHTTTYNHHIKRCIEIPLKEGRSDLSLNKTLNYVGLPEEPNPHNALTGAKMEAEAFSRLIHGKGLLDEFKKYEIPNYIKV